MRHRAGLLPTIWLVAMLTLAAFPARQSMQAQPSPFTPELEPGEVVVRLDRAMGEGLVQRVAQTVGVQTIAHTPRSNLYLYRFASDQEADAAVAKLQRVRGVTHVFRNLRVRIPQPIGVESVLLEETFSSTQQESEGGQPALTESMAPIRTSNDPARGWQWHLDKIKEPLAPPPPAEAPLIAIVDSGVDYEHPELRGKVLKGPDFVDHDADPMDENGHGTHLAGLAAAWADNRRGGAGVSPSSPVLAVRVLDRNGKGSLFSVIAGLDYAADHPEVRLINLSLGVYVPCHGPEYAVMQDAVRSAVADGKIVVAAAGNESDIPLLNDLRREGAARICPIPASIPEAFTVAATDENDQRAYFSNYNIPPAFLRPGTSGFSFVDVAAPGWNILSTTLGQAYARHSGTSAAVPIVAGAAARVWAQFPSWSNRQVEERLINTGLELGAREGFPVPVRRIDLRRALGISATGVQGQVIDPMSGLPLRNVVVQARLNGTTAASNRTNAAGFYTLVGLQPGATYTLTATRSDLAADSVQFTALSDVIRENHNLRPVARLHDMDVTEPAWHLALTWRDTQPGYSEWRFGYLERNPAIPPWQEAAGQEMNLYIKTPHPYILHGGNPGNLEAEPFARLTRDSFADAVAAEGATIRKQANGEYCVSVHLDASDNGWGDFQSSEAVLRLYKGRNLQRTVRVQEATLDSGTTWWNVLRLEGDVITVINELQRYPCWGSPDDDIPGIALPAEARVRGDLHDLLDRTDVYAVTLVAGQAMRFRLSGPASADFDLYVFGPDAPSIFHALPVARSAHPGSRECLVFSPSADGTYYALAWAFAGQGPYDLQITPGGECERPRNVAERPWPNLRN